jgi:serine acetyltransferase
MFLSRLSNRIMAHRLLTRFLAHRLYARFPAHRLYHRLYNNLARFSARRIARFYSILQGIAAYFMIPRNTENTIT